MKPTPIICLMVVSLQLAGNGYAQGFVNLGFETTTITPVFFPGGIRYTATVPGWTWTPPGNFVNFDPNSVGYNEFALDGPAVNLQGTDSPYAPAIQGRYSVSLQGGSQFAPTTSYSAIWQAGQVPATAESLIYWGGALQVTFNGQSLTPVAITSAANYTKWCMDISAYAGQSGELRFTKPWRYTNFSEGALLDNIQFSSLPVPEPSALVLCGVSVLFLLGTRLLKFNLSVEGMAAGSARLRMRTPANPAISVGLQPKRRQSKYVFIGVQSRLKTSDIQVPTPPAALTLKV